MDFFNRVRKIRTASQVNDSVTTNIITDKEINSITNGIDVLLEPSGGYNQYSNHMNITPSPIVVKRNTYQISASDLPVVVGNNGYGIMQNKSRKVYKLNNINKSHSNSSTQSSHDSSGACANVDAQSYIGPLVDKRPKNIISKMPVTPQSSGTGCDSGIDSGKRKVTQQDSNTSVGSVMSCHNITFSDLEERRQQIVKIAYKDDTRERIRQIRNGITTDKTGDDEVTNSRKPAQDLDLQRDLQKANFKKKKKKKDRSAVSHKLYNQNESIDNYDDDTGSCGSASSSDNESYDGDNEDRQMDNRKSIQPPNVPLKNAQETENSTSLIDKRRGAAIDDDFADDETDDYYSSTRSDLVDQKSCKAPIASEDSSAVNSDDSIDSKPSSKNANCSDEFDSGHTSSPSNLTSSIEKDDQAANTSSSDRDNSADYKVPGNKTHISSSHKPIKAQATSDGPNAGNNDNIDGQIKHHAKIEVSRKSAASTDERQIAQTRQNYSSNSTAKHYSSNNTVARYHPNSNGNHHFNKTNGAPNVKNENFTYATKFTTNLPKVPMINKVQPTSKRVNGVTLRDLYSLRAVLSDSDNGTVFSGRRRIDNAAVAIKRIMKSKVKRWHMIKEKSVPMEIALLRKVNETRHAGVVTLLEWFECSDCFLLVMARPTPVLDLFDYVSEKKRLDEGTSKMIFIQVVEAMYHCHLRSVLHRDIKLENILVKTDSLISTIIDFGCGTHLHSNLYKDFAGTPQYYPPEYYICKQYHGLPAAVWSVGVMLYAMLCGRLPFASAHEIVHLEPSWHGSFCRKISPAAKELVEHMLKKQPRRRLQMADVLKHRWLKNANYDSTTGEVTIITDSAIITSTNTQILHEILETSNNSNNTNTKKPAQAPFFP